MPDANDTDEADRIAAMVKASRADFTRQFDAVAAERQPGGPPQLHVLVQFARLGAAEDDDPGSDAFAFRAACRFAAVEKWLDALTTRLLLAGLLASPTAGAAAPAGLQRLPGVTFDLQAVVNEADGFPDPITLMQEVGLAARRVCEVMVAEPGAATVRGSGFLVGPQTVLTNWHVVRSLARPDGTFEAASVNARVKVRFGRATSAAAGAAPGGRPETETVRAVAIDKADAAYPDEYDGSEISATMDTARTEELLDYALLRLEGAPGIARGSYRLAHDRWPQAGVSILVMHFPEQFDMRVTLGRFEKPWAASSRRIRHEANTLSGSSGGLCFAFDSDTRMFRPVAMHQGCIKITGGANGANVKKINQAIPLAKIAPALQQLAGRLDGVVPISRLAIAGDASLAGKPVLGRRQLQDFIAEAIVGDARFIIVRPQAQPGSSTAKIGKSFSWHILRSMLPGDRHMFVNLSAREIPSDARTLAQLILDRVEDRSRPRPELPHPRDADTTPSAYITDRLLGEAFVPRLAAAAGATAEKRLIWLVIDDLDVCDLPDAGGRAFLDALYLGVARMPALRIMLIGLTRDLPSIAPELARIERLTSAPGLRDVGPWLERRFGAGRVVEPDIVTGIARIAVSLTSGSETPGPALAEAIVRHVDPNLPTEKHPDEIS